MRGDYCQNNKLNLTPSRVSFGDYEHTCLLNEQNLLLTHIIQTCSLFMNEETCFQFQNEHMHIIQTCSFMNEETCFQNEHTLYTYSLFMNEETCLATNAHYNYM